MPRQDSAEEAAFRAEVRSWLEAHAKRRSGPEDWSLGPRGGGEAADRDYYTRMRDWQRTLYEGGWAAITWAPEHGGRGGSPAQALIFSEEQAAFDVTNGFLNASISLVGPALIQFGTEAQRQRYLKPMLSGEEVWCQLFSEPEAGSDLAALRTRAVLDGDAFHIDGQKVWTSSGQHADYGFLLARTDPDVPKHDGISFLLLDMRQPGVEARPLLTMKGDRHFSEVFFTDARAPRDNLVNGLGGGWEVAKFVLMREGASIGTTPARGARSADLAREAQRAGRFEDAAVRQRLGEIFVAERVLELLQDRLRDAILDGRRPDVDGSVLKVFSGESAFRKAETANWLRGADALLDGEDAPDGGLWQEQMLGRSALTVGGGTSEVHRNGLGERALGLPREARPDRHAAFRDLKTSGS